MVVLDWFICPDEGDPVMNELEHFLARRKLQNLTERLNRIADAMREETMRKEFERKVREDKCPPSK